MLGLLLPLLKVELLLEFTVLVLEVLEFLSPLILFMFEHLVM